MPYYRSAGSIPPKRHTQHRTPEGGLYYEELMGEEGFSSESSLLYHVNIPSAVVDVRAWELPDQSLVPNHPLAPRHFSTHMLFEDDATEVDAVTGRRLLLGNGDVRLAYVVADAPSPLYRNAIGDECLYVESGTATVETLFGDLEVGEGDYVIIPRATTHRVVPTTGAPVRLYVIEANSHIGPPKRFLSRYGQLLEHAPYCERDLRGPTAPTVVEGEDVEVHIKHRGPGAGGIAGTVPYYHSNVDSDEVMFYCGGDYEARKSSGITQGSISLHPGGHPHGPQPGAMERSLGAEFFDELAVMVDTFRPLELGEGARATDDGFYAYSWSGGRRLGEG